ncbi:MAG: 50S ribosomal protein L33 [Candidatus Berkelbacteria bacterium]|nr:50S ribosomal protein L33 [Candidatus Berkelbacteria bacterium]
MAKDARVIVTLECEVCKSRNYQTEKNTKLQKERLSLKKYCKKCKKNTLHKETK